jgi:precorrin-6A/cobalt-precorrin-6A reductase
MGRVRRCVLVLGGTTEALALARALAGRPDLRVVTSLAGRTAEPVVPPGELRVGGFGGIDGLVAHLAADGVDAVIDATHPFAAVMPWHAHAACGALGLPRLRLLRPPWRSVLGDRWTTVPDLAGAAAHVTASGAQRVALTTGRTHLDAFVPAVDGRRRWLIRAITAPDHQPLRPAVVVLERGPFALDAERRLLAGHRIDLLVTKDSGGTATAPKLDAARALDVAVLMVGRPPSPPGPTVATAAEAVVWLDGPAAQATGTVGYPRGV